MIGHSIHTKDYIINTYIDALINTIKPMAYNTHVHTKNIFTVFGYVIKNNKSSVCANILCQWEYSLYKNFYLKSNCEDEEDITNIGPPGIVYTPNISNLDVMKIPSKFNTNFPEMRSLLYPLLKNNSMEHFLIEINVFKFDEYRFDYNKLYELDPSDLDFTLIDSRLNTEIKTFDDAYDYIKLTANLSNFKKICKFYEIMVNPEDITKVDIDWGKDQDSKITIYVLLENYDYEKNVYPPDDSSKSIIIQIKININYDPNLKNTMNKIDVAMKYLKSHRLEKFCIL